MEANYRSELLENVEYNLMLRLSDNLESGYQGAYTVKFDLKMGDSQTKEPLFLDFQGKQIKDVEINGKLCEDIVFDRHRI